MIATPLAEMVVIDGSFLSRHFGANIIPKIRVLGKESDLTGTEGEFRTLIDAIAQKHHTVLGIDIYRYSQYQADAQPFVPFAFREIYNKTMELVYENHEYIFQSTPEDQLRAKFVSTGDGGFQAFDTPLHAIVFAVVFEAVLRTYNSSHMYIKLARLTGEISLRYALTLDNLYGCGGATYGTAIINNARILSKDRLNRLLIDRNTYDWFLGATMGVENLQTIGLEQVRQIREFSGYDWAKAENGHNALIFRKPGAQREGIKAVDLQRIGTITEKNTALEVFNLHIQVVIEYSDFFHQEMMFTVSLGNLHSGGLG